jgi:hypothetical protein
MVNTNEAPNGFKAILKSSVMTETSPNACASCDWRKSCCDPQTDFQKKEHRCMSYPIISNKNGAVICRDDSESVVFKLI